MKMIAAFLVATGICLPGCSWFDAVEVAPSYTQLDHDKDNFDGDQFGIEVRVVKDLGSRAAANQAQIFMANLYRMPQFSVPEQEVPVEMVPDEPVQIDEEPASGGSLKDATAALETFDRMDWITRVALLVAACWLGWVYRTQLGRLIPRGKARPPD